MKVNGCFEFKLRQGTTLFQGLTITIKSPYVTTYMCQNCGVWDVLWQIPKSIYQESYLLPSDFTNNFS